MKKQLKKITKSNENPSKEKGISIIGDGAYFGTGKEYPSYKEVETHISTLSAIKCFLPHSMVSSAMPLSLSDFTVLSAISGGHVGSCVGNACISGASLYLPLSSACGTPLSHAGLMYQIASAYRSYGGKYIAAGVLAANLVQGMVLPEMGHADEYNDVTIGSGGGSNEMTLNDGDTATSTMINSGGNQYVNSGGTATNTIINAGGDQLVYGTATTTTINSGGLQGVSSGGTATTTTINGGAQVVFEGGTATTTTINDGGRQNVYEGGTATTTTINSRGYQHVYNGGTATSTIINNGGNQNVAGTATDTTINTSGYQYVRSGGTATDTTINAGGWQEVYSSGTASGTTINNGGVQSVDGTAITTTINGGDQFVYGTATDTTINSDGYQYVGGTASDTTINGGRQWVDGTATATTISGGRQEVYSGGTATATTISGGRQEVYSGGTASDTTINDGGLQQVFSGGTASDTTINGGDQTVSSGGTATDTTINGGVQFVFEGGSATDTTFAGDGVVAMRGGTLNGGLSLATGQRLDGVNGGTINGDVSFNGGTFSPILDMTDTSGGMIAVSGNVTGTASGTIDPSWYQPPTISSGETLTFDILKTEGSGTIDGTFGFEEELVKATYEQQLVNNNLLQLVVTGKSASFVEEYGEFFDKNTLELGTLLDIYDENAEKIEFLDALGQLSADGLIVNSALEQLSPLNIATAQNINGTAFRAFINLLPSVTNVSNQNQYASVFGMESENGINAGSENSQAWSVFASPFGMLANQDSKHGISGYDASFAGVNVGAVRALENSMWFGFAGAYNHQNLDMDTQNSEISGDQLALTVFGGKRFANNVFIEAALGYSHTWSDSSRDVAFGTYTDRLTADFGQDNFMARMKLAYIYQMENGVRFTPSIGIDYLYSNTDGVNEKGGSAALAINPSSVSSFQIPLDIRIDKEFVLENSVLIPYLSFGYVPELGDTYAENTAHFANASTAGTFNTQSVESGRHAFTIGTGLSTKINDNINISLDYKANLKDGYDSHSGQLTFEYKF